MGAAVRVYLHKDLAAALEHPNGCSFVFGLFGRCSIAAVELTGGGKGGPVLRS